MSIIIMKSLFNLIEDQDCGTVQVVYKGSFADCRHKMNAARILQRQEGNLPLCERFFHNQKSGVPFKYSVMSV
jgi:hypothetical protein